MWDRVVRCHLPPRCTSTQGCTTRSGSTYRRSAVIPTPRTQLTERQAEVLELIAAGQSNRRIASQLGITEDGVKAHIRRLFEKYGATNRASLVRAAVAGEGSPQLSFSSLLDALMSSLQEMIGATAARGVLRRALKRALDHDESGTLRASFRDSGERGRWPDLQGEAALGAFSSVARELWPLLIEMSGQVLVRRLQRGGLTTEDMQPDEVLMWAKG